VRRTNGGAGGYRRLAEDWLPVLASLAGTAGRREAAAIAEARRRLLAFVS
jgi:hypothetical protein